MWAARQAVPVDMLKGDAAQHEIHAMTFYPYSAPAPRIPEELAGPLPRRIRASENGLQALKVAAALLLVAVAGFLWGGSFALHQMQSRNALRRQSSESVAEINRAVRSEVDYTFTVNGKSFTGKAVIPGNIHIRHSDRLAVRYFPPNPAINHPSAWEWSEIPGLEPPLVPLMLVVPAIFLIFSLRNEARVLATGIAVVAVVTQCSRRGRGGYSVKFQFRTKENQVTVGGGIYQDRREIGQKICVLYLPQDPQQNQPYPSMNYRIAQ
jgi:hypothetical protein